MSTAKTKRVSISLTDKDDKILQHFSKEEYLTPSTFVKKILLDYLYKRQRLIDE